MHYSCKGFCRSIPSELFCLLTLQVQAANQDFQRFQKVVKLLAFHPFDSAENALENMNAVTEHEVTEDLRVSYDQSWIYHEIILYCLAFTMF
ncbi:hypothetical protein EON65_14815 [archaeon]|nr:MAG: hypothetical protein EON65_14815 [archaeon]